MDDDRLLSLGRVVGVHGVKGTVKVFSYAESASSFKPGSDVYVEVDGLEKTFTIQWARPHGKSILLALEGITTRDQAEAFRGVELFIVRDSLEKLEQGEYYWSDIIGLCVHTVEGEHLGRVVAVMQTGSNDVYVVRKEAGGKPVELLVPALEWVVREIDVKRKRMRVDLPEGLRDL